MAGAHQNVFIILGHGEEAPIPFEERPEVPEGVTLLTITQSGNPTTMTEVCPFLKYFSNPENEPLVKNPIPNKHILEEHIQKSIHHYTPGRKMPPLTITPMAYWNINGYRGNVLYQFVRSGVYSFPIPSSLGFPEFEYKLSEETRATNAGKLKILHKNRTLCGDHIVATEVVSGTPTPLKADFYEMLYRESVYPTFEEMNTKYGGSFPIHPEKIGFDYKISLQDLMSKLGPGIYYYLICRADKDTNVGVLKTRMENLFRLRGFVYDLDNPLSRKEKHILNQFSSYLEKEHSRIFNITDIVNQITEYLKIARVFPQMIENLKTKVINAEYFQNIDDMFDLSDSYQLRYITELEDALERMGRARSASNVQQFEMEAGGRKKVKRTRRAKRKSRSNSRNVRSAHRSYRSAKRSRL